MQRHGCAAWNEPGRGFRQLPQALQCALLQPLPVRTKLPGLRKGIGLHLYRLQQLCSAGMMHGIMPLRIALLYWALFLRKRARTRTCLTGRDCQARPFSAALQAGTQPASADRCRSTITCTASRLARLAAALLVLVRARYTAL